MTKVLFTTLVVTGRIQEELDSHLDRVEALLGGRVWGFRVARSWRADSGLRLLPELFGGLLCSAV